MSKAGASGPASAMGGLPRQRCCAFKDQHVMWGQRQPVSHCSPPPPANWSPWVFISNLCTSYPTAILAGRRGPLKSLLSWFLQNY